MTTYLFLTRHAKAMDGYAKDSQNPLSKEGIDIQKKLAKLLKQEKIRPDTIYTSPLLRAKQSAEILAKELSSSVVEEDALSDAFNPEKLLQLIPAAQENDITIFMVGHAPNMAWFANQLMQENHLQDLEKSSGVLIAFKKEVGFKKGKFIKLFKV